jgi:hypothetical protein
MGAVISPAINGFLAVQNPVLLLAKPNELLSF